VRENLAEIRRNGSLKKGKFEETPYQKHQAKTPSKNTKICE